MSIRALHQSATIAYFNKRLIKAFPFLPKKDSPSIQPGSYSDQCHTQSLSLILCLLWPFHSFTLGALTIVGICLCVCVFLGSVSLRAVKVCPVFGQIKIINWRGHKLMKWKESHKMVLTNPICWDIIQKAKNGKREKSNVGHYQWEGIVF